MKKIIAAILEALVVIAYGVMLFFDDLRNNYWLCGIPAVFALIALIECIFKGTKNYFGFFGFMLTFAVMFYLIKMMPEIAPFSKVWPMIIGAFGVGLLFSFIVDVKNVFKLKSAILFLAIAALFFVKTFIEIHWAYIVAGVIILIGVFMLITAIAGKGKKWDSADNEK